MRGFLLLCFIISITSCSDSHYYEESIPTSDEYVWYRTQGKDFNFSINNTAKFNVYVKINYITGIRWDTLFLDCKLTSIPKSLTKTIPLKIPIKDFYGEYLGDPELDVWTTRKKLISNEVLTKGNYQISIIHSMAEDTLPYITEVGLELDKI